MSNNRQHITAKQQLGTNQRKSVAQIIGFLKANRGPHSVHNIRAKTRIDLQKAENLGIKNSLQENSKVTVLGTTFEYRPSIQGINNKDDLRLYIQNKAEGVAVSKLEDAYVSAKSDLAKWLQTGRIVQFMNNDTKEHMCFWYHGRLRKHPIQLEKEKERELKKRQMNGEQDDSNNDNNGDEGEKKITMNLPEENKDGMVDRNLFPLISDGIIATWNDIKIPPTKEELQRQLEEVNLISGGFTKKRTRQKAAMNTGRQKKRRRITMSRMKLTNTHMLQNEELRQSMMNKDDDKDRELPTLKK